MKKTKQIESMRTSKHFELFGDFDTIINNESMTSDFDYKYFNKTGDDEIGIFKFRKDMLYSFTEKYSELPLDIILGFYITDVTHIQEYYLGYESHYVVKDKTDFFVLNRVSRDLKQEIINSFERYYQSEIYLDFNIQIDNIRKEIYQINKI